MYKNINQFLKGREYNESLKQDLYVNYIKYRESRHKEGVDSVDGDDSNLYLLFNRKNETEIQSECNGLILEKNTNKIVCGCYPDFKENTKENLKHNLDSVEYCEDGTVIRLYYYNNKWRTATKKCIDATSSIWSSNISFDEMFWSLFGTESLENLDKDLTYIFILLHIDNVLVVKHYENKLVYTGSINTVTNVIDSTFIAHFENNKNIKPTKKLDINAIDFENFNIQNYFDFKKRGLIFKYKYKCDDEDYIEYYKYDFDEFMKIKEIRGNQPYIRLRYLELLSQPEKLSLLCYYYPEYTMTYAMVQHSLMLLTERIYATYRKSHVKHNLKIDENHIYYKTMKQLHAQYKNSGNPITKEDVYNKLVSYNMFILKNLLEWK